MCGIFGFVGPELDRKLLVHVATLAGRRGPHACGWTYWSDGDAHHRRFHGSSAENAEALPGTATVLIGHSRLATSGLYDDLNAAQPIVLGPLGLVRMDGPIQTAGAVAIAHNGIARLTGEAPQCETDCDSETLARISSAESGPLAGRLKAAIAALRLETPFALLNADITGVAAVRNRLPLFFAVTTGGTYFCSVAFDGAVALTDYCVKFVAAPEEARDGR